MIFFFKQKTAYEIKECDWSSDVCSSDLFVFPITVEAFCQDAGNGCLANSPQAGKEEGMPEASRSDCVPQGAGYMVLSDHLREGAGTVFSCEYEIGHGNLREGRRPGFLKHPPMTPTVASSRIWRGSGVDVAQCLAVNPTRRKPVLFPVIPQFISMAEREGFEPSIHLEIGRTSCRERG